METDVMTRLFYLCLCLLMLPGCSPRQEATGVPQSAATNEQPSAVTPNPETVAAIEAAFGIVERDAVGTVVGVDLARARSSVDDTVLQAALAIPGLKKLRVAGNGISRETLVNIASQTKMQELFLQDTVLQDDDLAKILSALPELKRLTLRRCAKVTDRAAESFTEVTGLRNLALIEMNLGRETLEALARSQTVTALDVRDCSRLTPEDYALIAGMTQLTDLKIGGFAVSDKTLESVSQLPNLAGLTLEDTMVSPEAFANMLETARWKEKLAQLVLSRDMTLFDDALPPIQKLPKLKRLAVNGMMVTGAFLEKLAENESVRPKLETLSLRMSLLNVDGAKALQKYRELKSLDLSGVAMTLELAEIVATLDTLETLNLSDCRLTDQTVKPIRDMTSAKKLILTGNPLASNR